MATNAKEKITCTVLKDMRDNGKDYAAGDTIEMERFRAEAHAKAGIVQMPEEAKGE